MLIMSTSQQINCLSEKSDMGLGLEQRYLTPLSTIFLLYLGGQFY